MAGVYFLNTFFPFFLVFKYFCFTMILHYFHKEFNKIFFFGTIPYCYLLLHFECFDTFSILFPAKYPNYSRIDSDRGNYQPL